MSVLKVNQIQTANGVIMANLNSSGANIGFQLASTLAPAFNAYLSTNPTFSSGVFTKISFNTEVFDTANAFDNATNYRFQPTVAGYYQVNTQISAQSASSPLILSIYKNGSRGIVGEAAWVNAVNGTVNCSGLAYLNGSSDYLEVFCFTSVTNVINSGYNSTSFSASMVRSA